MAYSHHWRRNPDLTPAAFTKAVADVKRILETVAERGVKLAGPTGHGEPEISNESIAFNGAADCGHPYRDLGSPWPGDTATGIEKDKNPVIGPWYSGAMLSTRTCGGSCAAPPPFGAFVMDRTFLVKDWSVLDRGKYFQVCETHYKPYDLAVTASLIRLKEHMPHEIGVTSDVKARGFEDGKRLCRELFGYAKHFALEDEGTEVV